MKQLRVADLLANSPIDPEAHLDATWVERYARMLEALPPWSSSTPQKGCYGWTATIA